MERLVWFLTTGASAVIVRPSCSGKESMKRQYHKPSLDKREKLSAVTAGSGQSNLKTDT